MASTKLEDGLGPVFTVGVLASDVSVASPPGSTAVVVIVEFRYEDAGGEVSGWVVLGTDELVVLEEEDDPDDEDVSDENVEGELGGIVGHGKYNVMYEVPAQSFVQELVQVTAV